MPLLGLGIDLVALKRFDAAFAREGREILDAFLTPEEAAVCLASRSPAHAAARCFAAKEAVLKALGTGMRGAMSWGNVRISLDQDAAPSARLEGEAARVAAALGVRSVRLSVGVTRAYAVATAVLLGVEEGLPNAPRARAAGPGGEDDEHPLRL